MSIAIETFFGEFVVSFHKKKEDFVKRFLNAVLEGNYS